MHEMEATQVDIQCPFNVQSNAQLPRALSTSGKYIHIYQAKHKCLCYN